MKKIIVSCAPAGVGNGANMGMNTVDYAIHNICKEIQIEEKVIFARPWPSYLKDKNGDYPSYMDRDVFPKNFDYSVYKLGGEADKAAVLYWGDFQHGNDYQLQSSKRLSQTLKRQGIDINTSVNHLEKTREYFLLKKYYNEKKLPFKLGMYGGTLFQNRLVDYLDSSYKGNLEWLYRSADFVRAREAYSANMISYLKNDYTNQYLGLDAGFLNTKNELLSLEKRADKEWKNYEGQIGIYFGRSTGSFPRLKCTQFINKFSKKLKSDVIHIPWGYFSGGLFASAFGRFITPFINSYYEPKDDLFTSGDILNLMSSMRIIITDTYHVAVNSIALGVPVILIYEPNPGSRRNANMGYKESWRDKRALLFTTNNLADLLIASDALKNNSYQNKKVDQISEFLNDYHYFEEAYAPIKTLSKIDRKAVGDWLQSI